MFDLAAFATRLVTGTAEAIIYAGADGTIEFWNEGARRLFGFSESKALGQSLDIIIPPRLRERHWQAWRAMMRTGQSRYEHGHILSVPAIREDGTRLSVEFTIVPFRDTAGVVTGIAAFMRDATRAFEEIRSLREQVEALKSQTG